jgi:hypothetical protein
MQQEVTLSNKNAIMYRLPTNEREIYPRKVEEHADYLPEPGWLWQHEESKQGT